jgi:archaellum component FlaC
MAEDIKSLIKQITQLQKEIKNLGGDTFKDMNAAIKAFGGGIEGAKKLITTMNNDVEDLRDNFGTISTTLKNIVQDLKGAPNPVKETTKAFSQLESLTRKISDHRKNEEILTVKQLVNIKKQTAAEVTRLKENQKLLDQNSAAYKEVTDALNKQTGLLKDINQQVESELETEKKIQKTLGLTGAAFKGIAKSLEHIGIESEHFEKINEDLREAAKTGSGFKVVGAGLKSMGSSLKDAFKDPLVQITATAKLFHSIVEFANEFDHETVAIQRNLGISHEAAFEMNKELEHMAIHMGRTHKDVVAANSEINNFLGTSVTLGEKQLEDQVALAKNAGLEADERAGIMKFSLLTGKSQEKIYNSIGKQNKGVLSNKKVLSEVLKTSGQLAAQYKNNPDLIGKAVIQAQKLGMTLEQTKNISGALLNFEDSISAELEAELLTGQDLNLERARGLALQGDTAGAAAELMKNLGPNGLAKFQKMNVLQQESYAKALGMSTDELADSLVKQKQLDALGKQESASLKKKVEELKASGQYEKAAELEKQVLKGKSVTLAEQELSNSEKMAESAEKLKQSFMQFMVGPVSKAMNFFSGVIETISSSKILSALVGGVGLAATAASILVMGKGIINMFRSPKGTISNPMITKDISGGGGGGTGGSYGSSRGRKGRKNRSGRRSRRGRGGKFSNIANLAMTGLGMASMFGGGGEDMSGEDMAYAGMDAAYVASDMASSITPSSTSSKSSTPRARDPKTGKFVKASKAAKGGSIFGKVGNFFGGIGKKISGGFGGVKKILGGPIAKGFGKALGPIFAVIESVASVSSLLSDARERKSAGEKVDAGKLGKSLVQAAAYPIANLATNLIPGVGTAVSIADGILSAFGMSPIKWITDNLVGLIPDKAFSGLGNMAIGEKAMADGGIVTGPTRALVGEAGPEAVVPLDKFYGKIDELITVIKQGGNVYLDGTKVGTAMAVSSYKVQ